MGIKIIIDNMYYIYIQHIDEIHFPNMQKKKQAFKFQAFWNNNSSSI